MTTSLTLAQVTDTHLLEHPDELLRGDNPLQNLKAVLHEVARHQPDGLLLTGDLADQGSPAAYEHLQAALSGFDCPVYWLPGNHDDESNLKAVLQSSQYHHPQAIALGEWRLLTLNSVLADAKFGEGFLAEEQLQWLSTELVSHPHQPTAVALHHHPVPTKIDWMDQISLQNADDLLAVLDSAPQVRMVLFGHIHHALQHPWQRSNGEQVEFLGCPSSCSQIQPPTPVANHDLPGFRLIHLSGDGQYRTQVQRVQPALVTP
jgi:Icc protein